MPKSGQDRTEVLTVRFSKREMKFLAESARDERCTPAEYSRGAIIMACVMDGHPDAIKYASGKAMAALLQRIRPALEDAGLVTTAA